MTGKTCMPYILVIINLIMMCIFLIYLKKDITNEKEIQKYRYISLSIISSGLIYALFLYYLCQNNMTNYAWGLYIFSMILGNIWFFSFIYALAVVY